MAKRDVAASQLQVLSKALPNFTKEDLLALAGPPGPSRALPQPCPSADKIQAEIAHIRWAISVEETRSQDDHQE